MSKKIKTAVFPVGGLGTRFLPATKALPKEMLPVVNKPLIQYAYEEALDAGIEKFVFVTGRNKNAISNHFDHAYELQHVLDEHRQEKALSTAKDWLPSAGQVVFVRQQQPLGLGHAVWCARHLIEEDESFAILLADEMLQNGKPSFMQEMTEAYNKHGGNIIGVADVEKDKIQNYGIIDPDSDDGKLLKIKGMVEKPDAKDAPSNTSIIGRYILHASVFDSLEKKKVGTGGEIQLTDAMQEMLKAQDFYGVRFSGKRFDCGSKLGFLEANVAYATQDEDLKPYVSDMLKKYIS